MKSVVVKSGQTFADIAIQEYGAFEAAVFLALKNDMSITDALPSDISLKMVDTVFNKTSANYCRTNGVSPTSSIISSLSSTRIFAKQFSYQFN